MSEHRDLFVRQGTLRTVRVVSEAIVFVVLILSFIWDRFRRLRIHARHGEQVFRKVSGMERVKIILRFL